MKQPRASQLIQCYVFESHLILYDPPKQPKEMERSELSAEAITPAPPDHAGPSSHADPPGIHDTSGTSRTRPP